MTTKCLDKFDIHFIASDSLEIGLIPHLGGAVSHARFSGISFMRPWTGERTSRRTGGYPLVPFSNRIANGRFSFQDHSYQLEKNFGDHPHPIHGTGWQRSWNLVRVNQRHVRLHCGHRPQESGYGNWPFAFDAEQEFLVEDNVLSVRMAVINRDHRAMPAGLGWHSFFPRHTGAELIAGAKNVYLNDSFMLPEKLVPVPESWDFSQGKTLGYPAVDNCFSGWDGKARITWRDQNVRLDIMASNELKNFVLMTPPEPSDFFAFEPVSHANNAISFPKTAREPMKILGPGEALDIQIRMTLAHLQ